MRSCLLPARALLVALFIFAACGGDDGEDESRLFETTPYGSVTCDAAGASLAGRRELRLFAHGGLPVGPETRALQNYYKRHGLSFFTSGPIRGVGMSYALDTDLDTLEAKLPAAFPGANLSDEALARDPDLYRRVLAFTANYMLKPVVDFARAHGDAGTGVTNLVVIPQIIRPGGDSLTEDPDALLLGMAISPALLEVFAKTELDEEGVWTEVDLPAGFTPMMVLGAKALDVVANIDPVLRDLSVAHEFGHTGALVHRERPGNLMAPAVRVGQSACSDSLEPDQLATMRATLGLEPARQALRAGDGVPRPSPTAGSARPRLAPARFRAMLRGDRRALRDFLSPLDLSGF